MDVAGGRRDGTNGRTERHCRRKVIAALFLRRSRGVGMPNIPAHVIWRSLSKHKVRVAVWDASDARKSSKDGPAKYNPKSYTEPRIEALERLCIEDGIVVEDT